MRFLPLLRSGVTPKSAAEAFLKSFNENAIEKGHLCFEHAANFVMDCFDAVNLKVTLSAHDIENEFQDFEWPVESLRIYVFSYNKILFSPVEQFLYEICIETRKIQEIWLDMHKAQLTDNYIQDFLTPLELILQLIAAWHIACKQLTNPERIVYFSTYFDEPLARIYYQLLRGVTHLRHHYRTELPLLDSVCDSLLHTVQPGIKYPETHSEIVSGLLNIFHEDFHLFYEFSHSSTDFYYSILTTKCPKTSYQLVYESFIELLQTYGVNRHDLNNENINAQTKQRSLIITNFMVDSKMLNAYYHILVKRGNKSLTLTTSEFLNVLQSKLVSLDCFSAVFLEGILDLVLSMDADIGNKAAKLYITIMRHHSNVESIFEHIIVFYHVQMSTPESISRYVERIWKYFRPIQNVNYYAEHLQQRSKEAEPIRVLTAHFAVAIFNKILKEYDINDTAIVSFLQKLMDILKNLKCQITQGILLDVFDAVYKTNLENVVDGLKTIFISFELHAQHQFVSLENLQYPLLTKWFIIWETSASHTGNVDRINESASSVISQYNDFTQRKKKFFKKANEYEVRKYRNLLQRLSLITQSNHTFDSQNQILKDIRIGLMKFEPEGNGVFYDYAFKFKYLIDVYALEIYTLSLIKLYDVMMLSSDRSEYEWLESKAQELERHLRSWIQNTDDIIQQPVVRMKTLFICFLELHLVFGSDPNCKMLNLPVDIYEILVRLITHVICTSKDAPKKFDGYDEDSHFHPLCMLSYQRLMVERFGNFHKCIGVKINSDYIWHLCLYFGLPQAKKFKNELQEFLQILARYCFSTYKRIIPIIVFHLYKVQPALSKQTILNAIKAHKTFIDNLPNTDDRALLNVHIVMSVIERVEMAFTSVALDNHNDRLAPLQHLHKFIENLDLNVDGGQLIRQIYENANNFRRHILSAVELKTAENFINHFCKK